MGDRSSIDLRQTTYKEHFALILKVKDFLRLVACVFRVFVLIVRMGGQG